MKLVLASHNQGKLRELSALLEPLNILLIPQQELGVTEIEETGTTFIENAMLKARHAAQSTNLPALADDSGLVVPALLGAPGIFSARYAGANATSQNNIQKLLQDMQQLPENQRGAHFYCVLALFAHGKDPAPLISTGTWQGRILTAPQGKEGFGYDPIFYVPTENKSAAELTPVIKNRLSHRGQALQTLIHLLPDKRDECAFS